MGGRLGFFVDFFWVKVNAIQVEKPLLFQYLAARLRIEITKISIYSYIPSRGYTGQL